MGKEEEIVRRILLNLYQDTGKFPSRSYVKEVLNRLVPSISKANSIAELTTVEDVIKNSGYGRVSLILDNGKIIQIQSSDKHVIPKNRLLTYSV